MSEETITIAKDVFDCICEETTKLRARVEKLEFAVNVAKKVESLISDGVVILPKSGIHAFLIGSLKDCEDPG